MEQLIKQLSATPVLLPQNATNSAPENLDPQTSLQANKATFFFRLVGALALMGYVREECLRPLLGKRTRESQCILPPEGGRGLLYEDNAAHTVAKILIA